MVKKIYSAFRTAALAFAVVMCSPSCLEVLPKDAIHENQSMRTFADAEQTLTGIYAAFKSGALYSGALTLCPDIQSDFVCAVEGNSNQYGEIWRWEILSTNREVEAVYSSLYSIIGKCNFFLEKVGGVKDTLTDDRELTILDYFIGEVRCARALAYSELIKCFCEAYDPENADNQLGVVLRSSYSAQEVARRASLKSSYEFVLEDLEAAEKLLDIKNDKADGVYFTQAAVHAIRARVALFMKDWDLAVKESDKLINHEEHKFALANVTADQEALMKLWHLDSSSEIIWKVGFTLDSFGGALGQVFLNFNRDFTNYYPDYVPAEWILKAHVSGDARLTACFEEHQTGYEHGLSWPLLMKYHGNLNFINQRKLFHVNMPKPLRLAEQYLIQAEAYCQLGNFSAANAVINDLLKTRFVAGGGVNLSKSNWQEVIADERAKELYMEGFRLNDLKRWGMGFERKPQASTQKEGSSLVIKSDDPLFVWPIPKHELEAPGSEVLPNKSNR